MDLLEGNTQSKLHDSIAAAQLTHRNNDYRTLAKLENFVHTPLATSFKLNSEMSLMWSLKQGLQHTHVLELASPPPACNTRHTGYLG